MFFTSAITTNVYSAMRSPCAAKVVGFLATLMISVQRPYHTGKSIHPLGREEDPQHPNGSRRELLGESREGPFLLPHGHAEVPMLEPRVLRDG